MKTIKILLIFFLLNFLLFSCSTTKKIEEPKKIDTKIEQNTQAPSSLSPTETIKEFPSIEDSIGKIETKLREEPVYRECIARSIEMCGLNVISYFSKEKDSDEACNAFGDASLKKSCINAINTELARKKIDISLCDKVYIENQPACEQQVVIAQAIKEKDVKICEKLKTPDTSTITNSSDMPNQINNQDIQCIMQVIILLEPTTENQKICNTIQDDVIKQRCNSMIKSRINEQKNIPIPPLDIPPLNK